MIKFLLFLLVAIFCWPLAGLALLVWMVVWTLKLFGFVLGAGRS